jgi:alpha-N-arabinofuranosidase
VEYLNFDGVSPMTELRKKNGRADRWKVKFWGVGNENWGCGGNMRAEHYADQARRYATYCRNYPGRKLYKIACGPNVDDYGWTETLMKQLVECRQGQSPDRYVQAISLHNYSFTGTWEKKGWATRFSDAEWYELMARSWRMDELISRHATIMDRYDPDKIIGLAVDEWGTWHRAEEGTNPGFLYQQNSLRDALVAAIHLGIFHDHADRVRMANIAQTVNVLQAMILTDGPKMVLTPSYHVFEMNKGHMDAERLPIFSLNADSVDAAEIEADGRRLPYISVTVSRKAGIAEGAKPRRLASIINIDIDRPREVFLDLRGGEAASVAGRILTATALNAHNRFETPNQVVPAPFTDFKIEENGIRVVMPAHSFVTLEF